MRESRLVRDAVAILRALLAAVHDKDLAFKITRLIGNLELLTAFRSDGNYTLAKYTATYLERRTAELRSSEKEFPGLREPLDLAERIAATTLTLPDTVATIDRPAAVVTRAPADAYPSPGPYAERYPVGSLVEVASLKALTKFMQTWKYHHKLGPGQLRFAGKILKVRSVGYYHGGDPVYQLEGAEEFRWLEPCLQPVEASGKRPAIIG
jgi:hypothetical protein